MNSATTAELTCVIVQVQKGVHNELSNTTDLTCVIVQVMGGSVVDLECLDSDPDLDPTFKLMCNFHGSNAGRGVMGEG